MKIVLSSILFIISLNLYSQKEKYYNDLSIQSEAIDYSLQSKKIQLLNAAESNNPEKVKKLDSEIIMLIKSQNLLEAQLKANSQESKRIMSVFTTANKQDDDRAKFKEKIFNGEVEALIENQLANGFFGVVDGFKDLTLGLAKIITVPFASNNIRDFLNYKYHQKLSIGNATESSLTSSIKEYLDKTKNYKYSEIDGFLYRKDENNKFTYAKDIDYSNLILLDSHFSTNVSGFIRNIVRFSVIILVIWMLIKIFFTKKKKIKFF